MKFCYGSLAEVGAQAEEEDELLEREEGHGQTGKIQKDLSSRLNRPKYTNNKKRHEKVTWLKYVEM